MEIYLVGGAVRDQLMGRPVQDRDWVVVGGSPEALLAAGYQAVGGGFPVFLHPETREEYALARTERRTGPGHRGFSTWYAPDVTLEEDLRRRDLTINAMAMGEAGAVIDPFDGRADLEARWLRAVSPAFAEDPLRILRLARFAAQLPGFRVHPDTLELMRGMMAAHVLDELPAERVWRELDKAVNAAAPERFIEVLHEVPALLPWFDEWQELQPGATAGFRGVELLAVWCEVMTAAQVRRLFDRLKSPHHPRDFVLHVLYAQTSLLDWHAAQADDVLNILDRLHAFHPDSCVNEVFSFLERRHGLTLSDLGAAASEAGKVAASQFAGISGRELGEAIRRRRIELIRSFQRRR